jgi:hypothetical protein
MAGDPMSWGTSRLAPATVLAMLLLVTIAGTARASVVHPFASLENPGSLASDTAGNVYVAYGPDRRAVARVSPVGDLSPFVGSPAAPLARWGDGAPAVDATTCGVTDLTFSAAGDLWFTEENSHSVRWVGSDGTMHTRISSDHPFHLEDPCPPKGGALWSPRGVAMAPDGRVVVASRSHQFLGFTSAESLSEWSTAGIPPDWLAARGDGSYFMSYNASAFRVAGNSIVYDLFNFRGHLGESGDGGPAMDAKSREITGLTSLPDDRLIVTDPQVGRVRVIGGDRIIRNLVGGGGGAAGADQHAVKLFEPIDAEPIAAGLVVSERGANRLSLVDKTTITGAPPPVTAQSTWGFGLESWYYGPLFSCRLDDGAWHACGPDEAVGPLADGEHILQARATDLEGIDPTPAVVRWTVDTVPPPAFALEAPAASAAVQGRPTLRWAPATDATSGVERYDVLVDGIVRAAVLPGACEEACAWQPAVALQPGPHEWRIVAIDRAGHERQSGSRTFTVDTAVPQGLELEAPAAASHIADATPELSWSAASDDTPLTYEVAVDGTLVASTTVTSATLEDPLADGHHTWRVTAVDAAGNRAETGSRTFTVDTNPPETQLTGGPAAWTNATSASFDLGSDEPVLRTDCTRDGSLVHCGAQLAATSLEEGAHTVTAAAVDLAGNVDPTPAQREWSVDVTPPGAPTQPSPAAGAVAAPATTALRFTPAGDAGSGIEEHAAEVDGEPRPVGCTAGTCTVQLEAPMGHGSHTWVAIARDRAGNAARSAAFDVTVDAVAPPPPALTSPADGARVGSVRPQLAWEPSVDADSAVVDHEVRIDGAVPSDAAEGEHTWSVVAIDAAGNRSKPAGRRFTVDVTPPQAVISPVPRVLTGRTVLLDGSPSTDPDGGRVVRFEFDLDGDGDFERAGPEPTAGVQFASAGVHHLALRVVDEVGHAAVARATVDVEAAPRAVQLQAATVTIDDRAFATRSLDVRLRVQPPQRAGVTSMVVSNDGAFDPTAPRLTVLDRELELPWRLATGDGGKTTRSVYVFFFNAAGRPVGSAIHDDIVFDPVPPVLARPTRRRNRVRIRAQDRGSGVARVEVLRARGPRIIVRTKGTAVTRRIRVRTSDRDVRVRVTDRAGNPTTRRVRGR